MIDKLETKLEEEVNKICKKENLSIEEVKALSEIKTVLSFSDSISNHYTSNEKPLFLNNCCCEKTKREE